MQEPLTCIDIFSGCGGASLGFMLRGFQIAAAVDNDETACKTYRNNLGLDPMVEDITQLSGSEILKRAGMRPAEPTVLIGCPPCQGFSRLRKKKFDKRNRLVFTYLDIIKSVRPKFVLFENVPGIMEVARGAYFDSICDGLDAMGYGYVTSVLDAVNYGVPQFRKRTILLATRVKGSLSNLRLPSRTHCDPADKRNLQLAPWVTVKEAIGDLPPVGAGRKSSLFPNHTPRRHGRLALMRIKGIPKDGGSRRELKKVLWLKCHRSTSANVGFRDVYGRLKWDRPAGTITSGCTNQTKGRFLHPSQNRALTAREAARLQSFPDKGRPSDGFSRDFVFSGSLDDVSAQIGNALPVRLAEALADTVKSMVSY